MYMVEIIFSSQNFPIFQGKILTIKKKKKKKKKKKDNFIQDIISSNMGRSYSTIAL